MPDRPPSEAPLTNLSHTRPLRSLGVAALLAVASTACAGAQLGSANNDPDRKEWIDLFNGRNLDGWTAKFAKHEVGENYANTFRVVDGMIQARYDGYGGNYDMQFGHLYYDKPYSYYLVSHEYRFVGELYPGAPSYTLRNAGIMIHSQDPRTMPRDQNFPISVENQYLGGLGNGRPRTTGNMCSPGTMIDFNGKPDNRHCINSTSRTYDGDLSRTARSASRIWRSSEASRATSSSRPTPRRSPRWSIRTPRWRTSPRWSGWARSATSASTMRSTTRGRIPDRATRWCGTTWRITSA